MPPLCSIVAASCPAARSLCPVSPEVLHTGTERTPVVVIDDILPDPARAVEAAASLAPFPPATDHAYPGLRRDLGPKDAVGAAYASAICRSLLPVMRDVFGVAKFAIYSAGFSLVTTAPSDLEPIQSVPHVDTHDLKRFAVLHYLSNHENSGTAFFRHIATGFETITPDRWPAYAAARDEEIPRLGVPDGYIAGSSHGYEEIARVESRFNRLVVYPGALLHSGIVPDDFDFSPDPRTGRLTGNIFLNAVN